jgi:hypothetical protein
MRRAVVVGIAGLALLGGGSIAPSNSVSGPFAFDSPKPRGPLLGIVHEGGAAKLVRIDPRSLRPLARRGLKVPSSWTWAFSPDRSHLILPAHRQAGRAAPRASLRFVDVRRMRALGGLSLGPGTVDGLAWLARDRVLVVHQLCCSGTFDVVTVAPRARRILQRTKLEGDLVSVVSTRHELVLLAAPAARIGPSRLFVVDAGGRLRSVPLDGIWAGRDLPQQESPPYVTHHRYPGVAVDPDGRRVIVVPADGPGAIVDLSSLAVQYHTLSEPRSLLGRLRNWLEPVANAKASEGTSRQALWLGDGLLAVAGSDDHTFVGPGGAVSMRTDPAGLSLIDTNAWTVRRIDDSVAHVSRVGNLLLATGYSWDSSIQREGGSGLAGYGFDGTKRFHVFEGRRLTQLRVHGGRAYVGLFETVRVGATHIRLDDGSAFKVVDLASGRVIGTRTAPIPVLLVEESTYSD